MTRCLQVEPVTLEGQIVRLEPARLEHAPSMAKHLDVELFRYFVTARPKSASEEDVRQFLRERAALPSSIDFAIVLVETGEAIGGTTYLDIRPEHLALEIGCTWVARAYQGTRVNPEAKWLLLRHAFEVVGCQRVQLKTDGRNLQSQAAIEKLGARKEGVLRRYGQMPDGYMRDTVMYSILPEEWPAVESGLLQRLGR